MHQVDEHVALEDIERLTQIYESILSAFFSNLTCVSFKSALFMT
jgi:hypothetical protein